MDTGQAAKNSGLSGIMEIKVNSRFFEKGDKYNYSAQPISLFQQAVPGLCEERGIGGVGSEIGTGHGKDGICGRRIFKEDLRKKFIILRASPLCFIAHADPGAVGAGIDDMGVTGRQQRAFMRAAGPVPYIVADIVIKAPVQKAGKTAGCAHPEKKAADGEREIHAAVHDVSRREGTGVKPDFFPRILQEPEGVLLFFEGILFRNPDIDAASQVCGFHGIQDRDAGEELPADGSQNSVSPGIAFLGFIGQRLGHFPSQPF